MPTEIPNGVADPLSTSVNAPVRGHREEADVVMHDLLDVRANQVPVSMNTPSPFAKRLTMSSDCVRSDREPTVGAKLLDDFRSGQDR